MTLRWDDRPERDLFTATQHVHLPAIALSYSATAEDADLYCATAEDADLLPRIAARRAWLNSLLLERRQYAQVRRAAAQTLENHLKNAP